MVGETSSQLIGNQNRLSTIQARCHHSANVAYYQSTASTSAFVTVVADPDQVLLLRIMSEDYSICNNNIYGALAATSSVSGKDWRD
jgi:hypothetical protein